MKDTANSAKRPKVLIYTDCWFFSGSEEMPVHLLKSQNLNQHFDVTLAFRYSGQYQIGLIARLGGGWKTRLVHTVDPNMVYRLSLGHKSKLLRTICAALTVVVSAPCFIFNLIILLFLLIREKPSILHINNGGYPGAQSCRTIALVARILGVRAITMTVNNQATGPHRFGKWLGKLANKAVVNSVDNFITGSQSARKTLIEILELDPEDALCINNGVELKKSNGSVEKWVADLADFRGNAIVVGMVANHETRKGHRFLLEALSQQMNSGEALDRLRFVIEGDGPEFESNLALSGRLGLGSRVLFLGRITNVHDFMSSVDAIILPSLWGEDFPNVVTEAMALGKPIVAANLAGVPEQLEGIRSGFLFETGDDKGLAQALLSLVEALHDNSELGLDAKAKYLQCYTVKVVTAKYRQLFENLLDEGKSSHART